MEESRHRGKAKAPTELKDLRACMLCSLVLTKEQFLSTGCLNCQKYFKSKNYSNVNFVNECTSSTFEGLIAMMEPSASWVAKWQILDGNFTPGCYAISVSGKPPGSYTRHLESAGRKCPNRDRSMIA
jgi:transcription elongation factor SPT4